MKFCYHCMHQLQNERAHTCPQCGKSLAPEQQPDRFLKAGTVLGRKFVVGYPLGAGGFGNTYIGWDKLLFRKIAIKEFYPKQYCARGQDGLQVGVTDERLQTRFQRGLQQFLAEARNVAALHEVQGVVEISNFFEENGTGYIVMEYLEGMDVKSILEKSGNRKDYEWSRRVVLTVLYTLREIHKRGVLHRDIAPDNVFVTNEGIIKLIDFGAAKHASALENSADIMLKAGYAPVEQYSREMAQGAYTDMYAVAALFYRMLTGQKPLPVTERLKSDALIIPSEMGISLPEQAELAIMVCLNIQPEYRLQSAEEFMEALGGGDFVPVYEPEWILPPVKEKKGIFARFGGLTVGAKVAACCAFLVLAGGAAFAVTVISENMKEIAVAQTAVVMEDLQGKPAEEAASYLDKLNRRYGWDIRLETENTVFDLTRANGTVQSQSIPPGTALYDPDREKQEAVEGLEWDEAGKVTGTLSCTLYSSEKLRYSEIRGLNAYALAQKLGIDTADTSLFVKEDKGADEHDYFDLAFVEAAGKKISAQVLGKKENMDGEIAYSGDIKVHYYAPPFFYWKKLPDFAGKNINDLNSQPVYVYSDEKTRKKTGKKPLKGSALMDDSYYTVSGEYSAGQIIEQTVEAGTEYDGSKPGDEPLRLQVIGKVFDYQGKSGQEFIDEIKAEGFGMAVIKGSGGKEGEGDWWKKLPVADVRVYETRTDGNYETADEMAYFKKEDDQNEQSVCFYITVKEPGSPEPIAVPSPTPTPNPVPAPGPAPTPNQAEEPEPAARQAHDI